MAGNEHTIDGANASETNAVRRKPRHEGPKNHLLAFALSLMLTALAFLAVANFELEKWFVIWFIVILAIFQAVIQLGFWMHMKDKGHAWPIFGIISGFFVALTAVASGLIMSWW